MPDDINTPNAAGLPATSWRRQLDEREAKEVQLAELYAGHFRHGTDGHSRLMLIAHLAAMCDALELALLSAAVRAEGREAR